MADKTVRETDKVLEDIQDQLVQLVCDISDVTTTVYLIDIIERVHKLREAVNIHA